MPKLLIVEGQLDKAPEFWNFKDEKTGEELTGHAGKVLEMGGAVKFGCTADQARALASAAGQMVRLEGVPGIDRKTNAIKLKEVMAASVVDQAGKYQPLIRRAA